MVRKQVFLATLLTIILSAWVSLVARGQSTSEVPVKLQAAVFAKIFRYDRSLPDAKNISIVVVYQKEGKRRLTETLQAFQDIGLSAQGATPGDLAAFVDESFVLYLMPSAATPTVRKLCQERRILTVTGSPSLVEKGDAAIGVALKDSRSQIIVNLKRVKEDGHELAAEILQLARIIR